MSDVRDRSLYVRRERERGGSRLNFLIVTAILAALAYGGYQFIPVAYQASQLKLFMQDTVNNAAFADKKAAWVEEQLRKNLPAYDVPVNARINVANVNARMEARVQYVIPVPLVVTIYQYNFDYTARSANLLPGG